MCANQWKEAAHMLWRAGIFLSRSFQKYSAPKTRKNDTKVNQEDSLWFTSTAINERSQLVSITVPHNWTIYQSKARKVCQFLICIKTTFQSICFPSEIETSCMWYASQSFTATAVLHISSCHLTVLLYVQSGVTDQKYKHSDYIDKLQCHHHCQALKQWDSAVSDKSPCRRLQFVQNLLPGNTWRWLSSDVTPQTGSPLRNVGITRPMLWSFSTVSHNGAQRCLQSVNSSCSLAIVLFACFSCWVTSLSAHLNVQYFQQWRFWLASCRDGEFSNQTETFHLRDVSKREGHVRWVVADCSDVILQKFRHSIT